MLLLGRQDVPRAGERCIRSWRRTLGHSCVCVRVVPTVWNLNLSVANQLTGEEGLGVSVLDQSVLQHLDHAQNGLEGDRKHTVMHDAV